MISIIMPVYNASKSIKRSIESVLNQTYKDIELIIVNDGSKDNSEKIILDYQKNDSRIKYIYQENDGVASARNKGILSASGEYISFLDADDYLDVHFCENMLKCLVNEKSNLCICMNKDIFQRMNSEEEIIFKSSLATKKTVTFESEEYDFYDINSHWTVWGVLFQKGILDGVEFKKEYFVGEDTLFLAEVIKRSERITFLYEYLLNYVFGFDTASHGVFDEKKYTEITSWEKVIDLYLDRPKQVRNIKAAYAERCIRMIKNYYSDSDLFRNEYYKKISSKYRKNYIYILSEDVKRLDFKSFIKHFLYFIIPRIASKKIHWRKNID